jgi:hypothetical protein
MDPRVFDRLIRLFSAPRTRRTAWRILLGGALLGTTTQRAASAPRECTDKTPTCGTKQECCPGKCFVDPCPPEEAHEFCCVAPAYVFCGSTCCDYDPSVADPCATCRQAGPPPREPGETCVGGITGSYRRR